jgi:hypothetical protein
MARVRGTSRTSCSWLLPSRARRARVRSPNALAVAEMGPVQLGGMCDVVVGQNGSPLDTCAL